MMDRSEFQRLRGDLDPSLLDLFQYAGFFDVSDKHSIYVAGQGGFERHGLSFLGYYSHLEDYLGSLLLLGTHPLSTVLPHSTIETHSESIDRELFDPLREYLLSPFASSIAHGKSTGQMLESYLSQAVEDFLCSLPARFDKVYLHGQIPQPIVPIRATSGRSGNIQFSQGSKSAAEIDNLYIFHDDNDLVPVIFEFKMRSTGMMRNNTSKCGFVSNVFGRRPYFCGVYVREFDVKTQDSGYMRKMCMEPSGFYQALEGKI